MKTLRKTLAGTGCLVFRCEQHFNMGPDVIASIRSQDPYDMLRVMGTGGQEKGQYHEDIIKKVKDWDAKHGLNLVGAGGDWLEAEFIHTPKDMPAFAREVYAICPDVVDQGTGTVEAWAREMKRSNMVCLWWD